MSEHTDGTENGEPGGVVETLAIEIEVQAPPPEARTRFDELKDQVVETIEVCKELAIQSIRWDDFFAEVVDTLGLEHPLSQQALGFLQNTWGEFTEADRAEFLNDGTAHQSVTDWLGEQRYAGGEPL